jgi:hypothetical protein
VLLKQIIRIFGVIVIAFGLFLILFLKYRTSTNTQVNFIKKRIFSGRLVLIKNAITNIHIGKMYVNDKSIAYISDIKSQRIFILDSSYKVIQSLPVSSSIDEGKNTIVSSLEENSSNIYISNMGSHSFVEKDTGNKILHKYSSKLHFRYNVRDTGSRYILSYVKNDSFNSKLEFCAIDTRSGVSVDFKDVSNIFSGKKFSDMYYAGYLTKNAHQFFYACYYTDNIISFNKQGGIIFNQEAIYRTPTPEVIKESKYTFVGKSMIVTYSIAADNQNLYVLSAVPQNEKRVIDLYDCKTGKYKNSYYVAQYMSLNPSEIFIFNGKLFLIYDKYIRVFTVTF